MKKVLSLVLMATFVVSLIGCTGQHSVSLSNASSTMNNEIRIDYDDVNTDMMDSVISSYYSGQSSRAFKMLQKSIFKRLVDHWTDSDIHNPVWNYDTFTRYQTLDSDIARVDPDEELYCCAFSSDNGKFGYIVVSYDGDSLGNMGVVETQYLYDLNANIDDIVTKLKETNIDLSSAVASRVKMIDTEGKGSVEAIRIVDNYGNVYMCYFDETSITFADHTN